MTPDEKCPSDGTMMPRSCSDAFGDIRERMARMETTLGEVRAHQKSALRKAWEITKAAALFIVGVIAAKIGIK